MATGIDDEAAAFLAIALVQMLKLSSLDLSGNDLITAAGMRAFSNMLDNLNSTLEELSLLGCGIDDEVSVIFADALTNNTALMVMKLEGNQSISSIGWQAFSQLVCNKSSINDTFHSNHTLHQLLDDENERQVPCKELIDSLRLNRNNNKNEVVRQKILFSHFQGENINLEELLGMESDVMPHAIAWIGKDDMGYSPLYQLVRAMPSLVDHGKEQDSK